MVGFNWIASPAATELESIMMDWVGKMLMLPPSFLLSGSGGGVMHGSTCEALLYSLAAARDKVLKKIGHHKITKLVVYGSDQTHSTLQKASKLVGIPTSNFRSLPTSFSNDIALCPDDVCTAMEEDVGAGLVPLFLCATVGTTSSGAVDPLEALGHVAKDFKVWQIALSRRFRTIKVWVGKRHALVPTEYLIMLLGFLQYQLSLILNELAQTVNMPSLSQCGANCTAYDVNPTHHCMSHECTSTSINSH